jgi:hypothetical protein
MKNTYVIHGEGEKLANFATWTHGRRKLPRGQDRRAKNVKRTPKIPTKNRKNKKKR